MRAGVLRSLVGIIAATVAISSCGSTSPDPPGVETAAQKQRAQAQKEGEYSEGAKWGGWKYQGDRDDCFYRVGRKCFAKKEKACAAAGCKAPKQCKLTGAGPAKVSCE